MAEQRKPRIHVQMTRKSLPTRLREAGIDFHTEHRAELGGYMVYVINGEELTHREVEQRYFGESPR